MSESLSASEAAEYVGLQTNTLAKRRSQGVPPRSWKAPNGRVRYDRADLDHYLAARKASTLRGGV